MMPGKASGQYFQGILQVSRPVTLKYLVVVQINTIPFTYISKHWMRTGHWLGSVLCVSFSSFTLMVGKQEGHPACNLYHLSQKTLFQNTCRKKRPRKGADGHCRMTVTLKLDRVKVTSSCTIHIALPAHQTM